MCVYVARVYFLFSLAERIRSVWAVRWKWKWEWEGKINSHEAKKSHNDTAIVGERIKKSQSTNKKTDRQQTFNQTHIQIEIAAVFLCAVSLTHTRTHNVNVPSVTFIVFYYTPHTYRINMYVVHVSCGHQFSDADTNEKSTSYKIFPLFEWLACGVHSTELVSTEHTLSYSNCIYGFCDKQSSNTIQWFEQ